MVCNFNLNVRKTFASILVLDYNVATEPIHFMKTCFPNRTLIALAVALAAAVNGQGQTVGTTVSTSAGDNALPAGIPLGSPAGQVFKLAQAGVDASVIQTYISNCPTAFNLQADEIIALTDAGVSSEMVSAMFAHDKKLPAPAALPAPAPVAATEQAGSPPPAPTVGTDAVPTQTVTPADLNPDEMDQTLSPYGTWVQVEGYGRCWRPSVGVYDATWQPYCDRGSWVYTDYGWYWNSDYAWGMTFHYGRWFNSPQYGWCWWPNTVWAPAWVTWRSSSAYCGWAPLPPFTVYQPGIGFTYRGNHVAVGFDFGLAANCFTFVSVGHFSEPHPRYYCVPHTQAAQIYGQTTIINNYGHRDRTIVNNGVSVTTIGTASHRPIQPVPIGHLTNPGYRVGHGQNGSNRGHRFGADATDGSHNRQFAGTSYQAGPASPARSQGAQTLGNRRDWPPSGFTGRNFNSPARPSPGPALTANHNPTPATSPARIQPPNNNRFIASQRPQTRPEFRQPTPVPVQRSAPRQNYAQTAPRSSAPAAPAQPRSQGGNGRMQGWMARDH